MSQTIVHVVSAGEPVRPSEMGVPSDGGHKEVALRGPLRNRHWWNMMSTMVRAMQPVVRGVSIASKVEDVHFLKRLFLKVSCLKLGSTHALSGTRRIPSDDFGV